MSNLTLEKTRQAVQILQEMQIDLWLTFVRETSATPDPVLPLIYGDHMLTWQSALLITRQGERIAIVGTFEADTAQSTGSFDQVISYDESIRPALLETLKRLNPQQIAVNTSQNDPLADGLTSGMRLVLADLLADTPFAERVCSAERVVAALVGRKTAAEVDLIRAAIRETEDIYAAAFEFIRPGLAEREVADFMHAQLKQRGLEAAWSYDACPIVNAGLDTPAGHTVPSDAVFRPGQIVHMDFGIQKDGYCSDIQRVVYLLKPGESQPPEPVQHGFRTIRRAIQAVVDELRPGRTGLELDAVARSVITGAGYPEFKFATGHQLGRRAHDGGGILGPAWERYGDLPQRILEAGQVYTVEPGLEVPGYGYIGLEEDVLVTAEGGGVYLGPPQLDWILKEA